MSAVETDERIALPMDGPAEQRLGLPMAAPPPPSPVTVTNRAARAFGEILTERGHAQGALKGRSYGRWLRGLRIRDGTGPRAGADRYHGAVERH